MKPAGQSTREMQKRHHNRRMLILVTILAFGFLFLLILSVTINPIAIIFLAVGLVVVMKYLGETGKKEKRMEGKYKRGAVAEESIGELLDKLPGDNLVLHDVPSKFGNIDHVIISRTKGIILVETKSHHGRISAEGDQLLRDGKPMEKDFIKQTLGNCYWLKEWVKDNLGLEVWVNCVIVFTNGFVTIRGKIKGVDVINGRYFPTYFDRLDEDRTAGAVWEKREQLQNLVG